MKFIVLALIAVIYIGGFSFVLAGPITSLPVGNYTNKAPYEKRKEGAADETSIELGKDLKNEAEASGVRDKLLKFLGIYDLKADGGVGYVKGLINVALGLVGLIALCFMIYGFGRIFFAAGEEAVGAATTIIRISAIALLIIGTAWFIESIMFYIYNLIGKV